MNRSYMSGTAASYRGIIDSVWDYEAHCACSVGIIHAQKAPYLGLRTWSLPRCGNTFCIRSGICAGQDGKFSCDKSSAATLWMYEACYWVDRMYEAGEAAGVLHRHRKVFGLMNTLGTLRKQLKLELWVSKTQRRLPIYAINASRRRECVV